MMTPVLRQGWVVKQNMMWWWYFVAMLYRNIAKPSKHLQGGILTVTYCTFWIDIINKYYTFAQIGLKIKVFMIVMKWPKSSIEYCMECVDLCIQLSIRQSVTGQERVWSACPSMTSSNYHHPLVRWMMTQMSLKVMASYLYVPLLGVQSSCSGPGIQSPKYRV